MNDTDLKDLAHDYANAVLKSAARKTELTQDNIEVLRAAIVREFTDLIGPMLP